MRDKSWIWVVHEPVEPRTAASFDPSLQHSKIVQDLNVVSGTKPCAYILSVHV